MGVSRCRNLDVIDFWGHPASSFPWFFPFCLLQHPFSLGTGSCWEALRGKETSQGKRSSYEQITVGTGKPLDKGKGTIERELCNWLSIYVFQNTVSWYPTSQGDKKESFSVQACYISEKAHSTCTDRARRQHPKSCKAQAFSNTLSCHWYRGRGL